MAKKKKNPTDSVREELERECVKDFLDLWGVENIKTKKTKKNIPTSKMFYGRRCPQCKEVIVSLHVHDFRTCGCGVLSIDGGQEYCRLVGNVDFENLEIVQVRLSTGYTI